MIYFYRIVVVSVTGFYDFVILINRLRNINVCIHALGIVYIKRMIFPWKKNEPCSFIYEDNVIRWRFRDDKGKGDKEFEGMMNERCLRFQFPSRALDTYRRYAPIDPLCMSSHLNFLYLIILTLNVFMVGNISQAKIPVLYRWRPVLVATSSTTLYIAAHRINLLSFIDSAL